MSTAERVVVGGLALLRHGATAWSISGQHTGRTDLELLDSGRAEVRAVRGLVAQLPIAITLSSPLRRATATAEALELAQAPELCDDLVEWDYGLYEGLTSAQIHEMHPDWELFRDGAPGGEQPEEVARRADAVLARFDFDPDAPSLGLIVAHGHILRVLTTRYLVLPLVIGVRLPLLAAHLSLLGHEHGVPAIESWNLPPTARRVPSA